MPSLADTTREITEDVSSLSRVRIRFSKSTDHQLRTVVPMLVPKLFKRLEHYRTLVMNENENESGTKHNQLDYTELSRLEEARKKVYDIISMAISWLRRTENIPVESLARAVLPFLKSKNPVVGTWALAFLQEAIQEKISEVESSLDAFIIPHLIESLGELHNQLVEHEESSAIDTPLEAQWIGVSWLLLDSMVLHSGKRPLIDWDMEWNANLSIIESNNNKNEPTSGTDTTNKNPSGASSSPLRESIDRSRINSSRGTRGVFYLVLDLLLYKPVLLPAHAPMTLSGRSVRRMEYRIKKKDVDNAGAEEAVFQAFDGQQARFRSRIGGRQKWSDSNLVYFHHMQLACFKYAVSFPSNDEHAIVLSILFASQESMHGRIALSHLKKLRAENLLIPLPVVTDILSLIVGEAEAELLLDTFEKQHETNFREKLMSSGQRPAIDWKLGARAADIIIDNPLNWKSSIKAKNIENISNNGGASDEAYATLFVELSLKLSAEYQYVTMRLVRKFFHHIHRPQAALISKIFDLIMKILTALANSVSSEDLRIAPRGEHDLPRLVPVPFRGRNDLNKLLQSHRQSLKRKNMDRGIAIQAREDAYTMIPLLSAYVFEQPDASRFRLPILLLQCAAFESRCLGKYLTKALDSTLAEYRLKFDKDQSLATKDFDNDGTSPQQQAIFILPALLEAVCSGEEYVRLSAVQWIQKLLIHMDVEAARYLAGHLVCDEIHTISQIAKSILETTKAGVLPLIPRKAVPVSFISLKEHNGLIEVQTDLQNREMELAERLQIALFEESTPLLLQYKFSVDRAAFAFRENPHICQELCGLIFGNNAGMKYNAVDYLECGICYDEMDAESAYSLRCGHTFCKSCWVSYVTQASIETPLMNFLNLRCPHHGCGTRVVLHDLQQIKPNLIPKWNDALLKTFVEEDPTYRYCPGPDCSCIAVKSNQSIDMADQSLKVTCSSCATSFCFQCGEHAHAPASCQDIAQFTSLNKSSRLWVKNHTKPCPGCNVPIEKNQGCNHMHCSHCSTDFCWLCLQILNCYLEPHTCNHYDATDSAEDDFERQALFTFARYEAHDTAAIFTANQYKRFDPNKYVATFWFLDEDQDIDIMENALKTLLAGREFLKNSYIAMLGLRKDKKRLKLHENHHGCLEMFTERLSQLTETNLHRLFTLHGYWGVRLHFQRLAFYTLSVTKYTERMEISKDRDH